MSASGHEAKNELSVPPGRTISPRTSQIIRRGLADIQAITRAADEDLAHAPLDDIHEAVKNGDLVAVRKMLRQNPQKVNQRDTDGLTPLHVAATLYSDQSEAIVLMLLEFGADPNARGRCYGNTPLQTAAGWWYPGISTEESEQGIDINSQATCSLSADFPAVCASRIARTIEILLERGANPNAEDGLGGTALDSAACRGNAHFMELLLAKGSRIDVRGDCGETPLHCVAEGLAKYGWYPVPFGRHDFGRTAKLLINAGHEINPKDLDGLTPLDWFIARQKENARKDLDMRPVEAFWRQCGARRGEDLSE